ncbi:GGDEF domain-containing protein [Desulfovibrio sp. TomC]|uniref:GGDEF domain-containing protein n=1 Tax=Desulfovibrio sp. TomC TaxID=1562888 RepID=UPI000A8B0893|nr:GGDEF domain-containing protein [Desulfovibrio sp. TomC]
MLLLHNLNQDHPAIAQFDHGLIETLRTSTQFDVRVSAEYINVTNFENVPLYASDTARYLAMKYAHWQPEAVFADRAVTGLYTQYLREAFQGVPCFIAQDRGGEGVVAGSAFKTISWTTATSDIEKNLELIKRLRPGTNSVLVVLGASEEERRLADEITKAAAKYADRIACVSTSGLSHAALMGQVAAVPAEQAILYIRFALDSDGVSFVPAQVVRDIVGRAAAPVFVVAQHLIGEGAVGGYAASFELFGRRTALWMLDALDGREPSGEALAASINAYVFDQRALRRFGIREFVLPAGSTLLFQDNSLWGQYKWYVVSGVVLLLVETFLVLGLVVNRMRRRRAEAALVGLNATLEARVLERTRELHEANERLHEAKEELEALNSNLDQLSRTDSLTGLANRRHAEEALEEAVLRFGRYGAGQGSAVAMVDIDFFKRVNDEYGHEAGDDLLRGLARTMATEVRACDLVSRWGGEEFLLLLPGTGLDGAGRLLERIREGVGATRFDCRRGTESVTVSVTVTIGVSAIAPGDVLDDVVRRADAALYRGKEQGRNQIVLG